MTLTPFRYFGFRALGYSLVLLAFACGDDSTTTDAASPDGSSLDAPLSDASPADGGLVDALASDASIDAAELDASPGPDGLAPVLSNFRVEDANRGRLSFDSSEPITATTSTGFVLSSMAIEGIVINEGERTGHYFVVPRDFVFWDNDTIRYEGGSDIVDLEGHPLFAFSLRYVDSLIAEPSSEVERYVSTDATGSGDGTEADPWTVEQAFARAVAGQTVWIRAGDYGNQNARLANDGTEISPIKFIGYKDSPGDIDESYYAYGDGDLDASEMPLLSGRSRVEGAALELSGRAYVVIKNIQFQNYRYGIRLWNETASHMVIENVVGRGFGGLTTEQRGYGVYCTAATNHHVRIARSILMNASQSLITLNGDFHLLENVQTYADEDSATELNAASDYHIACAGNNNIIRACHSEHVGDLEHAGHGISLRHTTGDTIERNLVVDSEVINVNGALEFRHSATRFNVARNVTLDATRTSPHAGGLVFRDGASFNRFENGHIRGTQDDFYGLIFFTDTVEDGGYGQTIEGNAVINTIIESAAPTVSAINFGNATLPARAFTVLNQRFTGCTFYNIDRMFKARAEVSVVGTELVNNIVMGVVSEGDAVDGAVHSSSVFFDSYPAPAGMLNTSVDPQFVDAAGGDFAPRNDALNMGVAVEGAEYDRNGTERRMPSTAGAIETAAP